MIRLNRAGLKEYDSPMIPSHVALGIPEPLLSAETRNHHSYPYNIFDLFFPVFQFFSCDSEFVLEVVENGLEFQASILTHDRSLLLQRVYSFDIFMDFPCESVQRISVHSKHLSDSSIFHDPIGIEYRDANRKRKRSRFQSNSAYDMAL